MDEQRIAAARGYEQLLVPAVFEQWTPLLLDGAGVAPGARVLDVACGTGVLARAALARVGAEGRVAGLDPDPGMLAAAREIEPAIEWREGVAELLPYADTSFHAVVSQFGLMFVRDRPRAVREMLRVLEPGGGLAVAVWDELEHNPAYATSVHVLQQRAGRAAADALRAPFALGDARALASLFEEAGAASVTVTTKPGTARFPSVHAMVSADLRGWLPVMGVHLDEELVVAVLEDAEEELRCHATEDGRMVFDVSAHVVTAARSAE